VIGDELFISAMRSCGRVRLLVSEEQEECILFDEFPNARYAVACDPIDGSSNLDAGVSVGTIFAIYKLPEGAKGTKEEMLKPGTEMVASGFTMYGASAQLVITMKGSGVNGFTLDNAFGEFILTHPDMKCPKTRSIYSVNEGNSMYWEDPVKNWCESLKNPQDGGKPYSARYIGSMVADAYRTLLYGGIFAYPADKKSPKGKLRILYECAPMAMVFENGKSFWTRSSLDGMLTQVQLVVRQSTARWTVCWKSFPSTFTTDQVSSWARKERYKRSLIRIRSIRNRYPRRRIADER
jgi:fructose-1,6-bisphosphatase I